MPVQACLIVGLPALACFLCSLMDGLYGGYKSSCKKLGLGTIDDAVALWCRVHSGGIKTGCRSVPLLTNCLDGCRAVTLSISNCPTWFGCALIRTLMRMLMKRSKTFLLLFQYSRTILVYTKINWTHQHIHDLWHRPFLFGVSWDCHFEIGDVCKSEF